MKRTVLLIFLMMPLFIFANNVSDINIVFTGDIQGHLKPEFATYMNPSFPPVLGNAASFIPFVKKERAMGDDPIFISNGNIFTDNPYTPIEKIEKIKKFLDDVHYDFINFGVYDIMMGNSTLKYMANKFPLVSSNAVLPGVPLKQYQIIERDGVRIGIFGLVSEYAKLFNQSKYWNKMNITNELQAAKKMVSILKAHNVDIIVAVTDIGEERDRYIADNVRGIDFILGGFNGKGYTKPIEDKNTHTVIFRTYGKMGSIGLFHIYYDKDKKSIIGYKGEAKTLFDYEFPISDSILNAYRFRKINGKWISE